MSEMQVTLNLLLADRNGPEARAFLERLLIYTDQRCRSVGRACYRDLLSDQELEEVVAEVIKRLLTGALARFRGDSLGELLAFVRTITDRCLWQRAQRSLRERRLLEGPVGDELREWHSDRLSPEPMPDLLAEVPLSDQDQEFLRELVVAMSKAEYARRHGVSRAAVTQRVQRVRARIDALNARDQAAVNAWLHVTARDVLSVREE